MWAWPSIADSYTTSWNWPCGVGSTVSTTRRTSRSWASRYRMRSAMVHILSWCSRANRASSGTRAIEPSGLMISQITPAG